jgi:general secretion pathway protein G
MRFTADRKSRTQGFTLLDTIVVALVLGLLAFVAFPFWLQSAADVRTRLCVSNLAQIGRAVSLYATDHNDALPGNQHSPPAWTRSLASYANTNVYRCPEELPSEKRSFTYALNDFLTPKPYGARNLNFSRRPVIPAPTETLMFAEVDPAYGAYDHFHFADRRDNGYTAEAFSDQVDVEQHGGSANYLFADGHVDTLAWSTAAKPRLSFKGSKFVHPTGGSAGIPGLALK